MAKAKTKAVRKPRVKNAVQNAQSNMIANGLGEALGIPSGIQNNPFAEALSNEATLFKNLRFYLVSNNRTLLNQLYAEIGLVETVVDVPVDDGLRGGVEIKSKQLDEDQIKDLQISIDRDDDLNTVGQALKWNRLFGGAGVVIMTDQDPASPLNIQALSKDSPLEFRAVDMWELYWDQQNVEGFSAPLQAEKFEFYSYYGTQLHKSRVMPMKGKTAPSFIRPRLRGWGLSVVETLVRSLNQYLKSSDLGFEVLDEFKLDIYRLKNLTNTLASPIGEQKVRQRVNLANQTKNYQNAIVMDSEDEYDHKQLSFAGLADAMAGIRMQVASDMRMPLTKLFGISAAGFNSGEDDIEVYNSMVESQVRSKSKYDILRVLEIKCQKLFGFIPDDLEIEFKSLRILSSVDEENVKTQKFNRLSTAKEKGEITTFEFREACNKDGLLAITLDTAGDSLNPEDPDVADLVAGVDENEEPGANKPDTEASQVQNSLEDFQGAQIVTVGLICGNEVLTGQRRDNGLWTFPGGHRDNGETVKEAACREVLEESGIMLRPEQLKLIKSEKLLSHRAIGKEFVVHAFKAYLDVKAMPRSIDDPDQEVSVWRWVAIDPDSAELIPESRHAKQDIILAHLFGLKNSLDYDVAAFEADGGDDQFSPWHQRVVMSPGKVDEALWAKAKDASMKAFGHEKWQFITWFYKQHGGSFQ